MTSTERQDVMSLLQSVTSTVSNWTAMNTELENVTRRANKATYSITPRITVSLVFCHSSLQFVLPYVNQNLSLSRFLAAAAFDQRNETPYSKHSH